MMNAMQRAAWWNLIWTTVACVGAASTWPWLGFRATGFFGFLGFSGFAILFLRRPGFKAEYDERDQAIERNAKYLSLCVVYVFLMVGFTLIMLLFGAGDTVPGKWLNLMVWIGFALVLLVSAGVTLWQYREDREDAPST